MLLSCSHIEKSFGEEHILSDVTFSMEPGQKFALVGSNGTGKSTLLRILAGKLSADSGQFSLAKNASLGYLAQQPESPAGVTLYESVLQACRPLLEMESRLRALEARMQEADEQLFAEYDILLEQFDRAGGHTFRSEITGILKGLSFAEDEFDKPLAALSGGERTRAALGGLLIQKPDLLILDEPINHLDLSAIQWLEGFLTGYRKAVLVVAHDRFFLDRICDHVVDLSMHRCSVYTGNYTRYVAQKEERQRALAREYEKQQAEVAHQEAVIAKLRSYNREKSIRRAESRQKKLDRMERIDRPLTENSSVSLHFSTGARSGNDVLFVDGLAKAFGDQRLFADTSFEIRRQERVAVIGDNGTGKTTLLKILHGDLQPDAGMIRFGANVAVGYYDQAQQGLSDEKTVFQEISDAYPAMTETQIRSALAGFLFTGDDVFKPVRALSGGERARVALLKLVLSDVNLLMLDEPTNHLDMETKEILERALLEYDGTLLFVSHDRYFIRRIATRILELSDGSFADFRGTYEEYLRKKEALSGSDVQPQAGVSRLSEKIHRYPDAPGTDGASGAGVPAELSSRADWAQQKQRQTQKRRLETRLSRAEEAIAAAEENLSALQERYADPEICADAEQMSALYAQQKQTEGELAALYEEWETLSEELEQYG